MKIRVVQIWGFLMTVLGWIFVACTIAMEGWKVTSIGGMGGSSIIKVAWYWSSLWRACFTDSTAVTNCYDFPVLWSVDGHIQVVRGLLMGALSVGMLGFVLSMMGMECTFLGGKEKPKHRKVYAGGCFHILSGILSTCGYAVYAQFVSGEYFNPHFDGLKFDLGTPLFLGWVGSAFHMTGGCFYLWASCKPLCGGQVTTIVIPAVPEIPEKTKSTTALSTVSEIPSKSKLSSVSKLSSTSSSSSSSSTTRSDVSGISSRSERSSGSSRSSRSSRSAGRSSRSGGSRSDSRSGSESGHSSRSSRSSRSRASGTSDGGTVSSLSDGSRSERRPFLNTNYI